MGQKKQSGDAVYYDSSYLDAHLKYKDLALQRTQYSNEIYRVAGFCKYLSLALLAFGVFLLFLSAAYSALSEPVQAKNVTSRLEETVISPELERAVIQKAQEDSENVSAPNIKQTVTVFEQLEIDGKTVWTGFQFNPPYDNGLGEPVSTWCYTSFDVEGKTRRVDFFGGISGGGIAYNPANEDILTRAQFNKLKSGCTVK